MRSSSASVETNHARPFVGVFQKSICHKVYQLLAIFPHKNEPMAPRTNLGYPHEGPSVASLRERRRPLSALSGGEQPRHSRLRPSAPAGRSGPVSTIVSLNSRFQDLWRTCVESSKAEEEAAIRGIATSPGLPHNQRASWPVEPRVFAAAAPPRGTASLLLPSQGEI